jgi:hypothetical protein
MVEKRLYPPPPPSTPREAPWREIEEIIELLKSTATKLDILISIYSGAPVPGVPPAPGMAASVIIPNKKTWRHGQKNVTTAGTPEALGDLEIPDGYPVTVIAKTGNTGYIYLGKTEGACANSNTRFDGLSAGLAHSLRVKNLNEIWIDASVDGEGVSWSVEYDS